MSAAFIITAVAILIVLLAGKFYQAVDNTSMIGFVAFAFLLGSFGFLIVPIFIAQEEMNDKYEKVLTDKYGLTKTMVFDGQVSFRKDNTSCTAPLTGRPENPADVDIDHEYAVCEPVTPSPIGKPS